MTSNQYFDSSDLRVLCDEKKRNIFEDVAAVQEKQTFMITIRMDEQKKDC